MANKGFSVIQDGVVNVGSGKLMGNSGSQKAATIAEGGLGDWHHNLPTPRPERPGLVLRVNAKGFETWVPDYSPGTGTGI
jgi:hypothetical protein